MPLFSWFIEANKDKVTDDLPENIISGDNKKQNCNMWPLAIVRQPPLEKQSIFITTYKNTKKKHPLLKPIKALSADLKHTKVKVII